MLTIISLLSMIGIGAGSIVMAMLISDNYKRKKAKRLNQKPVDLSFRSFILYTKNKKEK